MTNRMRALTAALLLAMAAPLLAADSLEVAPEPSSEAASSPDVQADSAAQRVELGGGISMSREIFEGIAARPDGLATLERMQKRVEDTKRFEGVPHLVVIFVSVLVFFWSAMIYYQRKHARVHQTVQLMVEKGVPLPPELLRAIEESESDGRVAQPNAVAAPVWASNLLWGGLLWITVGIAGMLYLWMRGSDAWPWAIAALVYGTGAVLTAAGKNRKPG